MEYLLTAFLLITSTYFLLAYLTKTNKYKTSIFNIIKEYKLIHHYLDNKLIYIDNHVYYNTVDDLDVYNELLLQYYSTIIKRNTGIDINDYPNIVDSGSEADDEDDEDDENDIVKNKEDLDKEEDKKNEDIKDSDDSDNSDDSDEYTSLKTNEDKSEISKSNQTKSEESKSKSKSVKTVHIHKNKDSDIII